MRVMDGIDIVFHEAAIRITHCAEDPRLAHDVLATGTFNILEAAVAAKVKRVVSASSASIYGQAEEFPTHEKHHGYGNRTIYGATKSYSEGLLRSFYEMYGLNYVALRYFNVYGPRMDAFGVYTEVMIRWMERLAKGQPCLILGDGAQTMDFVFVTDIARANLRAANSSITDDVLNIASGTETSLTELATAARSRDGRRPAAGIWSRAEGHAGVEATGGREKGGATDWFQGEGVARRGTSSACAVVEAREEVPRQAATVTGRNPMTQQPIPFLDLVTPHRELEDELVAVFREALRSAAFIGGPQVEAFEREFAAYCGTKHCVGVANGTDAVRFALMAAGVGHGDAVVTVSHTFIATVEAISQAGAETEFVDIDERTYCMSPQALADYLEGCAMDPETGRPLGTRSGKPIKAIVPVHLYGQVADMDRDPGDRAAVTTCWWSKMRARRTERSTGPSRAAGGAQARSARRRRSASILARTSAPAAKRAR